ncbi:hypothetical protein ABIB40_000811 [Pedobacter sp. UYP30]|uniref:hypothetical protein n=1 Tax=Pedobacter sp. UYP30 TaxID=1756400 RepID=UPI0033930292
MKIYILPIVIIFLICQHVNAQSKVEIAHAKKLYAGIWVNKKAKRYLAFYFDKEVDYITINDWTGNSDPSNNENIDAYKASIRGDKLIMAAKNGDHHAPYCEIEITDRKLVYRCNSGLNFKDNFINKTQMVNNVVFERVRK